MKWEVKSAISRVEESRASNGRVAPEKGEEASSTVSGG